MSLPERLYHWQSVPGRRGKNRRRLICGNRVLLTQASDVVGADAETENRIVACLDHCEGVPTHILTMGTHPPLREQLKDAAELAADLRRQRDELQKLVATAVAFRIDDTWLASARAALARCTP